MLSSIQVCCVMIIALGSGLLGFSSKFEPRINFTDSTTLSGFSVSNVSSSEHFIASATSGLGTGFLVLGLLGFILPWMNRLGAAVTPPVSATSARTIAVVAIWLSLAVILTFGVFNVHWNGAAALGAVLIIVAVTCAAAIIASALVCGWQPWIGSGQPVPSTAEASMPGGITPADTAPFLPTGVPSGAPH